MALPPRSLIIAACLTLAAALAGCMAPPQDIKCYADNDGNHISWAPVENATRYNVYRILGDSEDVMNSTLIGSTETTSFTDEDIEVGQTYTYWVTSVGEFTEDDLAAMETTAQTDPTFEVPQENESLPSEPCTVTAVPFFGGPILAALALAGCVGAYVVMRRR